MAIFTGPTPPPRFPSGRYVTSNPLRREAGLRLLTANQPEALRALLLRAWRRPYLFTGLETPLAVQSANRQRPAEAQLPNTNARILSLITLTELEVTRRVLEAPRASISRVTRNTQLVAQGAYLRCLYIALVKQLGSAEAALAEVQRLLNRMG